MKDLSIDEQLERLKKRREMAAYQRKITTQIWTVWEYDEEISVIDRQIKLLEDKS